MYIYIYINTCIHTQNRNDWRSLPISQQCHALRDTVLELHDIFLLWEEDVHMWLTEWCVSTCVCICIYSYICVYVCMCIYMHSCTHTHMYIYIYVCLYK